MVREFLARGLFYWLRAPKRITDLRHDEYLLAIARVFLSACCLAATLRAQEGVAPNLRLTLSLSYLLYSLLMFPTIRTLSRMPPLLIAIHCADILWAVHLALLIRWPAMSVVLLLFVFSCAVLRWGFWEIQLTAVILFLILPVVGSSIYDIRLSQLWSPRSLSDLLVAIFLCIGFSLITGLVAEVHAVSSEKSRTAGVTQTVSLDCGFEKALQTVSAATFEVFGATQLLVAVHEHDRDRASLFSLNSSRQTVQSGELDPSRLCIYFFPAPAPSWSIAGARQSGPEQIRCLTLDSGRVRKGVCGIPDSFLAAHPFRGLLAVALEFEGISVRIYLIDPLPWFGGAAGLRYLDRSVRQVASIVYNIFTTERLKNEAEAQAGSRVARELHDGIIQSLSTLNLQLEAVRKQTSQFFSGGADPLARIQQSVQEEVAELRDFSQQMRSVEVDSERFLGYLSGLAFKFECEYGIHTKFVANVDQVPLRPRVCVELVRIAQEALVNIRKHSNASEALVRFGNRDGYWVLSVIDNGRGFGFSGRLSHEELQASGRGPSVIMERARGINARVSIESVEKGGSCLEVAFPREANS